MAIRYPIKVTGNVRGQSGNLATQLDSALVTLGWSIQATASNRRIYAPGSGGTGLCFYLDDNAVSSSREAVARICQSTSTLPSTFVNACPSTTQRPAATCRIRKSATSDATDRPFAIVGDARFFILVITHDVFQREIYWFGDAEGGLPGDAYNAVAMVRNVTDSASGGQNLNQSLTQNSNYQAASANANIYCARNIGGTVISDIAGAVPLGNGNTNFGLGAYPHTFTTGLHYAPIPLISSGSATASGSSAAAGPRGLLPFIFDTFTASGLSGLADGDTWTDTAYDPGGLFEAMDVVSEGVALALGGFVVLQTDGEWNPNAMRPA